MEGPFISWAAQRFLRSGFRGRTRLTLLFARHSRVLQSVPVRFMQVPTVYMDLRMPGAHTWFRGSPWRDCPREQDEQQVMRQVVRAGDVVYDIGANLGLHTALLSHLVGAAGRVFAFEPNPELQPLLRRTAREAGNCEVHAVALSDRNDTATLFVPIDHSMGSLADWTNGRRGRTAQVSCRQVPLDDLVRAGLPVPDFIKCDVEGAELKVFSGARTTLDQPSAPIVLFEAGENTSRGFGLTKWAAVDFLSGLDRARYTFFVVGAKGDLEPLDRDATTNLNLLAVPEARRGRCASLPVAS